MKYILLLFVFSSNFAEARVFRFGSENFAGYFNLNAGLSNISSDAFAKSSGNQTLFSDEVDFNYSGEVGVVFNTKVAALLIGLEIIAPQKMDVEGLDNTGIKLMDLESNLRATTLKATLLFPITMTNNYRSYFSFSGGYTMLSLKNSYDLSVDGQTTYPSLDPNYIEKAESESWLGAINLGVEYNFSDTATLMFEAGYRYMPIDNWEYTNSGTGFNGAHSKGDNLINSDGFKRSTDFSGFVIGLGFRFYTN